MLVTLIHFIIKQGIVDMIFKDGILGLNHREKTLALIILYQLF